MNLCMLLALPRYYATPTGLWCVVTGRAWRGTAFGGCKGRSQLPGLVDMYMHGDLKVDEFVTHTMPLEKINDAFDLMHEGKGIRSVVVF